MLKSLFNFYLDASIHVAFAVISLTLVTYHFLDVPYNFSLLGFMFFGVIVCYNFVKYGVEAYKYLVVSNAYHRIIQIFSFLAFVLALYFLVQLDTEIWLTTGVMTLLSALYAVPLLPKAHNLRNLGGFKIYIVALVWMGFTLVLPTMDAGKTFQWDIWISLVQRFIFVIVLILPFDIRDLRWDDAQLKTLPQVYGTKNTQGIGIVLVLIFYFLTFLKDELRPLELGLRLIPSVATILALLSIKKIQSRYFVSFWVEGIPILWFFFIWLQHHFY